MLKKKGSKECLLCVQSITTNEREKELDRLCLTRRVRERERERNWKERTTPPQTKIIGFSRRHTTVIWHSERMQYNDVLHQDTVPFARSFASRVSTVFQRCFVPITTACTVTAAFVLAIFPIFSCAFLLLNEKREQWEVRFESVASLHIFESLGRECRMLLPRLAEFSLKFERMASKETRRNLSHKITRLFVSVNRFYCPPLDDHSR